MNNKVIRRKCDGKIKFTRMVNDDIIGLTKILVDGQVIGTINLLIINNRQLNIPGFEITAHGVIFFNNKLECAFTFGDISRQARPLQIEVTNANGGTIYKIGNAWTWIDYVYNCTSTFTTTTISELRLHCESLTAPLI